MDHAHTALLDRARQLGRAESGLVVVVTTRADGSPHASVVNAGILDHPVTGEPVVGFVARGEVKKLANIRARRHVTVVFRSGWEWAAVEGDADLAGPNDQLPGFEPRAGPQLLRSIYAAAVGGTEDEWAALDDTIASEGHTAVLVHPERVYSSA